MSNTPEANKVLILGMKKLAERKREILDLKEKYFKKWKQEEADKEEAFRNERYAERLRVNGFRD